jgi:hypothetical protein
MASSVVSLLVVEVACDSPTSPPRLFPAAKPTVAIRTRSGPADSTVTLGFSNPPNYTVDSTPFFTLADTAFLQITYSGFISFTRWDGTQMGHYGPVGDYRGGRDGLSHHLASGWFIIQPSNSFYGPDTLLQTIVDSTITSGTGPFYARRASSSGETCIVNGIQTPCYTYSGTQTFAIHFIQVPLQMTAPLGKTVSGPGGVDEIVATTMSYGGNHVPFQMTEWSWTPRGLVSNPKGKTNVDSLCVTSNYLCWPAFWETGTVRGTATVNFYPAETASVEIFVPCPTGDTGLDNHPAMRDSLLNALGSAWRKSNPNDPNRANHKEQAGWMDSAGVFHPNFDAPMPNGDDACNSTPGSTPNHAYMPVHVHPFAPHVDSTPATNCFGHDAGVPIAAGPSRLGPKSDMHFLGTFGLEGLVMDKDSIYRYNRKQVVKAVPRYSGTCQVI